MHLVTPPAITGVAWQGDLVPSELFKAVGHPERLPATLGRPEVWPAAAAPNSELSREWTPPLGGADYYLVRLTLQNPGSRLQITDATESLYLRPKGGTAGPDADLRALAVGSRAFGARRMPWDAKDTMGGRM